MDADRGALDVALADLVETIRASSAAEWAAKPPPGEWSAPEIVDHLVQALASAVHRLDRLEPIPPAVLREVHDRDLPYLFYQGDEPTGLFEPRPTGLDQANAIAALETASSPLRLAFRDPGEDVMRSTGAAHPLFGWLDGSQWQAFHIAHIHRHRAQLIGLLRTTRTGAG